MDFKCIPFQEMGSKSDTIKVFLFWFKVLVGRVSMQGPKSIKPPEAGYSFKDLLRDYALVFVKKISSCFSTSVGLLPNRPFTLKF